MIEKPNFFIVGTPKGGTTSLFYYLEEHPEVFVPKLKEPHYFSSPEVKNTYYKTKIIDNEAEYLNLFNGAETYKAIGDLSTSYLFNSKSAKRIKDFNPKAKIIIVIRNPVDRAISHYLMDYNLGYIDVPFSTVLNNRDKYNQFYREYVELGFYFSQIENYLKHFDSENVLTILSEELFKNSKKTIAELYQFIGTDSTFSPNLEKRYNQYSKPRFGFLKGILQSDKTKNLANMIPSSFKTAMKSLFYNKDVEKPLFEKEKNFLREIYKQDVVKTSKLLNRNLNMD